MHVDFNDIETVQIISFPELYLSFINYKLKIAVILTNVPIAHATIVKHIRDHKFPLWDGLSTFLASFLDGPSNTMHV